MGPHAVDARFGLDQRERAIQRPDGTEDDGAGFAQLCSQVIGEHVLVFHHEDVAARKVCSAMSVCFLQVGRYRHQDRAMDTVRSKLEERLGAELIRQGLLNEFASLAFAAWRGPRRRHFHPTLAPVDVKPRPTALAGRFKRPGYGKLP